MFVFPIPKGITKTISSINRYSLWKGTSNSHGIYKVTWHKIIKSKPFGGLGLRSFHNKNFAMSFKWLWNLDKGMAWGWQELFLWKYMPYFYKWSSCVYKFFISNLASHCISNSLNHSIATPLQTNIEFKVGDERNIRFWTDSWLGFTTPLQFMFPRLYNLSL